MSDGDKDGNYCSICGGIPPDRIRTRKILVDDKETGIDQLDFVIDGVRKLGLQNEGEIGDELVKRVRVFNYVPTKRTEQYRQALLVEYRKSG